MVINLTVIFKVFKVFCFVYGYKTLTTLKSGESHAYQRNNILALLFDLICLPELNVRMPSFLVVHRPQGIQIESDGRDQSQEAWPWRASVPDSHEAEVAAVRDLVLLAGERDPHR